MEKPPLFLPISYESLIANIPGAIYRLDSSVSRKIEFISDFVEELTGYPRSYFQDKSVKLFRDLIHPDDMNGFIYQADVVLMEKMHMRIEYRIINKDEKVIWLREEARVVPDPDSSNLIINGFVVDITDQKIADDRNKYQVEWNQRLLATMLEGFLLFDHTGKILEVNEAFCHMHGYEEHELLTMNVSQVSKFSNNVSPDEAIQEILLMRKLHFEAKHKHRTGRWLDVGLSISVVKDENQDPLIACFVKDITHRKNAQKKLQHEQAKTQFLNAILKISVSIESSIEELCFSAMMEFGKYGHMTAGFVYTSPENQKGLSYLEGWHFPSNASISKEEAMMNWFPGSMLEKTSLVKELRNKTNVLIRPVDFQNIDFEGTLGDLTSAIFIPIHGARKLSALLVLYRDKAIHQNDDIVHAGNSLMQQIGLAVQRKRAQSVLAKREKQYRVLIQSTKVLMYSYSSEGEILFANNAFLQYLGYDRQELTRLHMRDVYQSNFEHIGQKLLHLTKDTEENTYSHETCLLTKSDGLIEIEEEISWSKNKNGRIEYRCVSRDITERKKVEVRQSVFDSIAKKMALNIGLMEFCSFAHDEISKILKFDLFQIIIHDYSSESFRLIYQNEASDAVYKDLICQVVNEAEEFPGLQSLSGDKMSEFFGYRNLACPDEIKSVAFFPLRSEYMISGALVLMNFDDQITYDSKDMEMLSYTASELGSLIARKEVQREVLELNEQLEERVKSRTMELQNAQEELLKSLEKERELSEMKSHFVSTASHQFRTPLTVIQNSLAVLDLVFEDKASDESKQIHRANARIRKQIEKMTQMMDDVLILGKLEATGIKQNKVDVNLKDFCTSLLDRLSQLESGPRKMTLRVTGTPRSFSLDVSLLDNALSNLISNAFKYSRGEKSPEMELTFDKEGVEISVIDFGIGIPPNELQHIFDPFYRASNTHEIQGAGLGMTIVKEYVELNGGEISIESTPGVTTQVHIRFKG